jgi:2-polyprenyl-3-methyl-5-hydroxy-6-metoxy-1,4-benzoquinol methylase
LAYLPAVTKARYDAVADSYGAGGDDYSSSVTQALLDLVGPVAGLRVLDLACGHGLIAREMARRGARVVGVDLSAGLVDRARSYELHEPLGVVYVEADVTSQLTLVHETFDVAVSSFGLSDIDDLDGLCASVARFVSVGGRFVFSILHPCFSGVDRVSGSWPTGERYYDERWWLADGELSALRREVGANHRMVSTYVNTLRDHNLVVDRMAEPEPEDAWISGRPGADALPVYLVVSLERVRSRT